MATLSSGPPMVTEGTRSLLVFFQELGFVMFFIKKKKKKTNTICVKRVRLVFLPQRISFGF